MVIAANAWWAIQSCCTSSADAITATTFNEWIYKHPGIKHCASWVPDKVALFQEICCSANDHADDEASDGSDTFFWW